MAGITSIRRGIFRNCPIVSADVEGARPGFGFVAFVLFIASIMALSGLGISIMLPALPAIDMAQVVVQENER